MKNLIMLLAVVIIASSCISEKRCSKRYPCQGDTIKIIQMKDTIIYRDTSIFIHFPLEIQLGSVVIPCPKPPDSFIPDTARAETSLAIAKAWWQFPMIRLSLVQKDTTIETRLKNALKEVSHWRQEYEKIKVVNEKKQVPGIYKYALGGWIGLIIIIIFLALIRKFKPF